MWNLLSPRHKVLVKACGRVLVKKTILKLIIFFLLFCNEFFSILLTFLSVSFLVTLHVVMYDKYLKFCNLPGPVNKSEHN